MQISWAEIYSVCEVAHARQSSNTFDFCTRLIATLRLEFA
jgi:hypothetical protein